MNRILNQIPAQYRPYLLPLIVVVVIIALSATLGRYMVSNILDTRTKIESLNAENKSLQAKVQVLSTVDQTKLSGELDKVVQALPAKPSTLPALSSLRSFAFQRNLDVSSFNVKDGSIAKSPTKIVEIDLTVVGSQENVVAFLADVKSAAPLMQISNADITNANDTTRANLIVFSYWGPLPTTLGKSDTPIDALKPSEQDRLNDLQNLKSATGGALIPSSPQGKDNPFTF